LWHVADAEPAQVQKRQNPTDDEKRIARQAKPLDEGIVRIPGEMGH
jgi:hypothetical protein